MHHRGGRRKESSHNRTKRNGLIHSRVTLVKRSHTVEYEVITVYPAGMHGDQRRRFMVGFAKYVDRRDKLTSS